MYLYCVHELHMSEDAAFRRIRVARAARRFPSILAALADGRLNLTSVLLVAPHLTEHTAADLLAAAEHKSKAAIELLLAERFPRPDMPTCVKSVSPPVSCDAIALLPTVGPDHQLAPGPVVPAAAPVHQLAPELVVPFTGPTMPMHPAPHTPRSRIVPVSPGRFALQVTVDQETHEQLRYAQSLLRHALPSGDVAEVLKRALDSLVRELEQKKFGKCARSRAGSSEGSREANGRHVPAGIRRTVSQRDRGQCTFVSDNGKRCEACEWLEFDHVKPVARGGETTSENLRLRCRAHNQYAAEREFGARFMESKRGEARERKRPAACDVSGASHQLVPEPVGSTGSGHAAPGMTACEGTATRIEPAPEHVDAHARRDEVIPWLRQLGLRVDEAKRGAAMCDAMLDVSLEERVRFALSALARARFRASPPMARTAGRCRITESHLV